MSVRSREWGARALLTAVCLAVAGGLHYTNRWLELRTPRIEATGDVGPLPDGRVLHVLSLGFERIVADLFWLRTVYYVGDEASHRAGYPAAARLAELVTDIDPAFHTAYVMMNSVLTVLRPDHRAAIQLLDKGIVHLPDAWRLRFLQGFNYFWYEGDYARAAEMMRSASERGGPAYLPLLAARLYHRAGDPDTAIAFVKARLLQAETPEVRAKLERRLSDLWIARDLAAIDAALERHRRERGGTPRSVSDLVAAGLLPREPRDPQGAAYRIRDGRAACDIPHDPLELHGVKDAR